MDNHTMDNHESPPGLAAMERPDHRKRTVAGDEWTAVAPPSNGSNGSPHICMLAASATRRNLRYMAVA